MVPAFNPMSCSHLAVPAKVMQRVAQVESGGNRFAIGVVGGRLERQPRNLGEAVATARMLQSQGYDYSLGIAQINRSNLARYGLDTFEQAFDTCANLAAGARILAECYGRSGNDWGKAFSCYYSGNFTTGYRDGYVRRILNSLGGILADASEPITVRPQTTEHPSRQRATAARPAVPGSAAYRVSIRSADIDSAAGALVSAVARPADPAGSGAPGKESPPALAEHAAGSASAFVPRVSGPGDPPRGGPAVAAPAADDPALRDQEATDAAFVF